MWKRWVLLEHPDQASSSTGTRPGGCFVSVWSSPDTRCRRCRHWWWGLPSHPDYWSWLQSRPGWLMHMSGKHTEFIKIKTMMYTSTSSHTQVGIITCTSKFTCSYECHARITCWENHQVLAWRLSGARWHHTAWCSEESMDQRWWRHQFWLAFRNCTLQNNKVHKYVFRYFPSINLRYLYVILTQAIVNWILFRHQTWLRNLRRLTG